MKPIGNDGAKFGTPIVQNVQPANTKTRKNAIWKQEVRQIIDFVEFLKKGKTMIPTIILSSLVVYLVIVNWIDRERANAREEKLLTRLMSRDAQDYALAISRLKDDKKAAQTLADVLEQNREDILPVD